jgi:hypothetical protein
MRLGLIFLLGLFLLSFVNSETTEADITFTVGGCSFEYGDIEIGVTKNSCSIGDSVGLFYCDNDGNEYITSEFGYGCSRGKDEYNLGDSACCPEEHFCNEVDGLFRCERATEVCADFETESACDSSSQISCTWLEDSEKCVQFATDQGCGDYGNQTTCEADELDSARIGVGTEIIGTIIRCGGKSLSVSEDKSSCVWKNDACKLNYVATPTYVPEDAPEIEISCSNTYTLGDCVDGKQSVDWTSNLVGEEDFPAECIDALGCNGGESSRFCGESVTKLPGFSLFSLFASIFTIGIFYFLTKK